MIKSGTAIRHFYIDWLRVIAILMLFVYHSARFFTVEDWHVSSATGYIAIDYLLRLLGSWGIPFLFVISGASTYYALGRRNAGAFFKERAQRLLVPLVVAMFTHAAFQVYLERLTHGEFSGSFWSFYPHLFNGFYLLEEGGNFPWMGLHLWYLLMLFLYSAVCYPLMAWLRRGSGMQVTVRISTWLARQGVVYLLAVPVWLVAVLIDQDSVLGATILGGWSMALLLFFFVYGFLLVTDEELPARIESQRWLSFAGGLILMAVMMMLVITDNEPDFGTRGFALFAAIVVLNAWCWVLALWGFGRRHLDFGTSFLWYASEAVLPFYILHQTVLVCVGYFVLQWGIPDLVKWLAIFVLSLSGTIAIYALLVRPFNAVRFLFGMKPRPRSTAALVAPPTGTPALGAGR